MGTSLQNLSSRVKRYQENPNSTVEEKWDIKLDNFEKKNKGMEYKTRTE